MRVFFPRLLTAVIFAFLIWAPLPIHAQSAPENFRWVDFHAPADQDVVIWVTRALTIEKWTAIREIGVEFDAALVITSVRASPQSAPKSDLFNVWSVSLTNHAVTPLIKGMNLRLLDWMLLSEGRPRELGALYDSCVECDPSTFFTTFHYDLQQHAFAARWIRGDQAAPVWTANASPQIEMTQLWAMLARGNGEEYVATLRHFDYGPSRPEENFAYIYDVDPFTDADRVQVRSAKQADAMVPELCHPQNVVDSLERGQNSELCQPHIKSRSERRPTTTPPANNRGLSSPPGAKHN